MAGVVSFGAALDRLPQQMADLLAWEEDVRLVAREAVRRQVYAASAGPNKPHGRVFVVNAGGVIPAPSGWVERWAHQLRQWLGQN